MTGYLIDIANKHPKLPDEAFKAAEEWLSGDSPAKWKKGMSEGESSLSSFASFGADGRNNENYTSRVLGDACHAKLATCSHAIIWKEKIACVAQPIFEGKSRQFGTTDPEATTIYLNWLISDDNPFAWILDDRCRSVEYIREKGVIFNVQGLPLGPCVHMFKVVRVIHENPTVVKLFADMIKEGLSGRLAYLISQGVTANYKSLYTYANHWSSFDTASLSKENAEGYIRGELPDGWVKLSSGNAMYYAPSATRGVFNSWTKKAYEEATKTQEVLAKPANIDAWGVFNPPPEESNPYQVQVNYSRESILFFAKKWQEEIEQAQLKVAA